MHEKQGCELRRGTQNSRGLKKAGTIMKVQPDLPATLVGRVAKPNLSSARIVPAQAQDAEMLA